ncbi:MAG TPA: GNAT family N-acetyltransferase, partial [Ktedonobacterales bacterium]|nr:GNAT family N-acetyltransferase [Ktedonobacterales bacterium]
VTRIRELAYAYPGENLHVADLPYRLCAPSAQDAENVRLFEDGSAQLLAFGIVQAAWGTLDYFIRPAARDHGIEDALMTWAVERFQRLTDARSRDLDWWIDTRADVPDRAALAARYGCTDAGWGLMHLRRPLDVPFSEPRVPDGFTSRPLAGVADAAACAALQRAAFASANMTTAWRLRTLAMPEYLPELDLVTVAPDGRHAAFCLCWLHSATHEAQVEPIAVHPDFQRLGLGHALLYEVFHRMRSLHATSASVESSSTRAPALALYTSAGCREAHTSGKYARSFQPAEPAPA